jgi:serine/threonine protein kinase
MLTFSLPSDMLPVKLNILIDQDRHARLADFGLSTIISESATIATSASASIGGTLKWMSPELLDPERFSRDHSRPTKESDCYALGMVIYEVLAGKPPFVGLRDHIILRIVPDGKRPGRPEGVRGTWFTDDLWKMLGLCWSADTQSRPSISAVLEFLDQVSGTWKPLPPQVDEGVEEDEDDLDLAVLTV